jgi:hypothetical protein
MAGSLVAAEEFDETFYATAAQVIPVLLLTLVFQLRLRHRRDDEELGLSLQMLATFLAMALGELSAFVALREKENLRPVAEASIWIALVWGTMMIAATPILSRWEAVDDAMPRWLSVAVRYGIFLGVVALVFLGTFGVVDAELLPVFGAVVVIVFALAGMAISDFRPVSRGNGRNKESTPNGS